GKTALRMRVIESIQPLEATGYSSGRDAAPRPETGTDAGHRKWSQMRVGAACRTRSTAISGQSTTPIRSGPAGVARRKCYHRRRMRMGFADDIVRHELGHRFAQHFGQRFKI